MSPESPDVHHASTNGGTDVNRSVQPIWRNVILNTSANLFVIPMNTGIIGILMHQLPYQFNGLDIIADIMYIFTLIQFIILLVVTVLRWIMFTKTVAHNTGYAMDELCFTGAAPIAFFTLTTLTSLIVSNTAWGHYPFTIVAYVMWWLGTVWQLSTAITVCIMIFQRDLCNRDSISTALCIPIVGLATNALIGGFISYYSYHLPPNLAIPVIIVSYLLLGSGLFTALLLYAIFFGALMSNGWPSGPKRPLLMLLVGPAGQCAAALLALSNAAVKNFGAYNHGTFLTASSALSLRSASTLLALLLLGFDILFIFIAVFGILEAAVKKQTSYSIVWWATIFPLATTTTTFIELSIGLDSPAFRGFAAAFLLILVIDWLANFLLTCIYGIGGHLIVDHDREVNNVEKID